MKIEQPATASVILEKRTPRKGDPVTYPIKLRVMYQSKYRYYILKYKELEEAGFKELHGKTIYLTAVDYGKAIKEGKYKDKTGTMTRRQYKTLQLMFSGFETKAKDVIKKMGSFTFESFQEKYFDKPKDDQDVFAAIAAKAAALRKDAKFNTATILEALLTSLQGFTGKEKYPFGNITVKRLREYEKWMLEKKIGKKDNQHPTSQTTISIYIRALQKIFNDFAPEGVINPFKCRDKYIIPVWEENKRALSLEDVLKIAGYPAIDGTMEQRSRDLWLFSYLCNGINFKDLANLKYANIKEGERIEFIRIKTLKRGRKPVKITAIITIPMARILDRWQGDNRMPEDYIFPIQKKGMTPEEQHHAIKQVIKTTNKYMKRICADLEIPKATTYVARHSFATVLKRMGVSVEFISEQLGHRNISTTQDYLKNFELKEKRKRAEMLLPERYEP